MRRRPMQMPAIRWTTRLTCRSIKRGNTQGVIRVAAAAGPARSENPPTRPLVPRHDIDAAHLGVAVRGRLAILGGFWQSRGAKAHAAPRQ